MEYLQDIWQSIYENKDVAFSFGAFVAISILLFFIFVVSFLGCVLPMLPGVLLAFAGILIWKLTIGAEFITWFSVFFCALLTVFAQILDFWLPIKYTPTKQGAWGAFWGVLAGVILSFAFPPFALLFIFLTPPILAFVFEYYNGDKEKAWSSSKGAFLGTILSVFVKSAIIFVMILIAVVDLIIN